VKQTICKFCDTVLIEGQTCHSIVENKSKAGRKLWADILMRKCHTCGKEKRYPINATRPKRKTLRGVQDTDHPAVTKDQDEPPSAAEMNG
jgi:ribonuclease P protein subunit RPR2